MRKRDYSGNISKANPNFLFVDSCSASGRLFCFTEGDLKWQYATLSEADNLNTSYFLSRYLGRITSRGRAFIPQIDGLRFVAIMAVICYHVQQIASFHLGESFRGPSNWLSWIFTRGSRGVQLFFVISGFILVLPFARDRLCNSEQKVSLRQYLLRRVTRLEPPYIIHLLILLTLTVFVFRRMPSHEELHNNPNWLSYASQHLAASAVYGHCLLFGQYPYPNLVLWSLEVEVQFYILAPFLAAAVFGLSSRRIRRSLLIAAICLWSFLTHFLPASITSRMLLLLNLQCFLAGFLLADLYVSNQLPTATARNGRALLWDLLFLAGLFGMLYFNEASLFVWFAVIASAAAFKGSRTSKLLANVWITSIGGMCYTIYMYHSLIISCVVRITRVLRTGTLWLDYLMQMLCATAILVPVCAVLFMIFERPFMARDWPRSLVRWLKRSEQDLSTPCPANVQDHSLTVPD